MARKPASERSVTFSKRKQGLRKKASELATLCGAEVMVVMFSPGGKVFSFGHPSPDAVMQRFLGEHPPQPDTTRDLVAAQRSMKQRQLNFHLTQLKDLIDVERKKGKEIARIRRETEGNNAWERPIKEINDRSTLEFMFLKFKEFKENLDEEVRMLREERESFTVPSNNGADSNTSHNINVMGGGTYFGPMIDPKGKGIASEPPNSLVNSYDPIPSNVMGRRSTYAGPMLDPKGKGIVMVEGSSAWKQVYPMMGGFNGGVSSSSQTVLVLDHIPFESAVPFNPMAYGSSIGGDQLNPWVHGFDGGAKPYGSLAGSSSETAPDPTPPPLFGEMTVGSSSHVPLDPKTLGFNGGQHFEPMEVETSGVTPSDHYGMGSTSGGDMSFDPNTPGPSNDEEDDWSFLSELFK